MFVNDNVKLLVLYVLGWNISKFYAYLDRLEVFNWCYLLYCVYMFFIFWNFNFVLRDIIVDVYVMM